MILPLNLNLQLNATSALWANDSTLENVTEHRSTEKGVAQDQGSIFQEWVRAPKNGCATP